MRVLLDQGVSFDMNYLPELYAQVRIIGMPFHLIFTFCEIFIKEQNVKELKIFFRPSPVRAVSLKSMIVCICSGF